MFFFSSRRRHTRCSRDWSSDVCSSDLTLIAMPSASRRRLNRGATGRSEAQLSQHRVDSGRNCGGRSEEHTSELQSRLHLVCRLLLEKKKNSNATYPYAWWTAAQSTRHS